MNRSLIPLLVLPLFFSCCKSNEKAYQAAFEKMKEKDAEMLKIEQADILGDSSETLVKQTSTNLKVSESVTVVFGDAKNLSRFNIVLKSFINRTNAKSLYERMKEEGRLAVLVQNSKKEYRVIVESCKYEMDADKILNEVKKSWPDAWILVRY